ncbi:MAG: methylmalonyl-CoA carboxyltransferase [Thermotogae bacterium]|nr:methylmalonyl-CoA carboxyltransferase [Thermotogota bacterium]
MVDIEDLNKTLEEKKEEVLKGGGEKRIAKQHSLGKHTARERIALLLDKDSFVEFDMLVKHRSTYFGLDKKILPADGVITGWGKINGRPVAIFSQDFTVQGGSLGEMHAKKICKAQDFALKNGMPIIGINDSGGARIQEGVDSLYGYGEIFYRNTIASGVIPQISVILGPSAGGAVYSPAITDFVFMVDKISRMFITGPQVIKAVTGEEINQENLGGAIVHNTKSGNAHFFASTEEEAMQQVRKLLSYIPQNNSEEPSCEECEQSLDTNPKVNEVIPTVPTKSYDVREVIKCIVDEGSFLEVHERYAKNMSVGFARFNGYSVGIVANQPQIFAGALDINASDKAARFIRFLDAFNIPIVTFVDTPGFLPGVQQEYGGIIRHGAKLLFSYSEATVPKITVILRKAYGGAYIAMGSQHLGADQVFALPTAEIAVMGPEGAANIIFARDIKNADDPEKVRTEKISDYKERFANPYVAASRGYVDAVIKPTEMRKYIVKALDATINKRQFLPKKKHNNIPL